MTRDEAIGKFLDSKDKTEAWLRAENDRLEAVLAGRLGPGERLYLVKYDDPSPETRQLLASADEARVAELVAELEDVHHARVKAETEVTRLTLENRELEGVRGAAEGLVRWHRRCGLSLRTGGALVLLDQRLSVMRVVRDRRTT